MTLSIDKTLRKAQNHIKAEELAKAEELYKQVLAKFPKNKKAIQGYQKLKAGIIFNDLSRSEPPSDRIEELVQLYNQGQYKEVLSKITPLISLFPKVIVLHNLAAAANAELRNLDQAIAHFRKVLTINPKDAMAYFNVGNIQKQQKKYGAEIESYKKALSIRPDHAESYNNMGSALKAIGDLTAAIDSFKQALKIKPNFAEAYYNLGVALQETGELDDSIKSYTKACEIKPNYIKAYFNLGKALKDKGCLDAAIDSYKQAIRVKSDYADAYNNIGSALKDKGELDAALRSFEQAITIKPDYAEAYYNMGVVLQEQGNLNAAIDSYTEALRINPNYVDGYNNKGNVLKDQGELDAALRSFEQAIKIKPNYAEVYSNIGNTLKDKGDLDAALRSFEQAIKLQPNYAEAYSNKSLVLLSKEEFRLGWSAYEWRLKTEDSEIVSFKSTKSSWNPSKVGRVLLWGEQGIGDEVMFASLILDLHALCSKLIVKIDKRLISLFRRSFPDDIEFRTRNEIVSESEYDNHIAMGSLPQYFRQTLDRFKPSSKGWLCSCDVKTNDLRQKLLCDGAEILIGISWQSTSSRSGAEQKAVALAQLAKALVSPKVKLINLQYGEVDWELDRLRKEFCIDVIQISEIDNKNDIDGLAALIMACDKVVSIENFTIDLAGALGKKSHVLLPFSCDWRWGRGRNSCYWYDSVCLHRQTTIGDWDTVLEDL